MVNNLPVNAGDKGDLCLIPGPGRPPGVGNGNSLQYSCLENSMDNGTWQATVHRAAESWTQLSTGQFPRRRCLLFRESNCFY